MHAVGCRCGVVLKVHNILQVSSSIVVECIYNRYCIVSYHCTCTCIYMYVCLLCVVHQYQLSLFCWPYPVGSRLSHLHLLSGGLLPLLSLLETTMVRYAHTSEHSKEAHSLRVVRVKLDNGKRVIGVRYPLPLISEVASMLRMVKNSALVSIYMYVHICMYMYMCVFVCMCIIMSVHVQCLCVHTSLL